MSICPPTLSQTNCAELCNLSGFSAEASAFQPASKADKFVSVQSSADITHVPSLRQVFDGHGGSDAADYAKANLWKTLKAHALYVFVLAQQSTAHRM